MGQTTHLAFLTSSQLWRRVTIIRQRMKGNTKLMMGYLFNLGLRHCRISWLLRGPGASSPGDPHMASQRLLTGTRRKCQEYPRAHSCLPVAQPQEKGKRKRLLELPHSTPPLTTALSLPSSSKMVSRDPNSKPPSVYRAQATVQNSPAPKPPVQQARELANCLLESEG